MTIDPFHFSIHFREPQYFFPAVCLGSIFQMKKTGFSLKMDHRQTSRNKNIAVPENGFKSEMGRFSVFFLLLIAFKWAIGRPKGKHIGFYIGQ